jgi:hypothetical protein
MKRPLSNLDGEAIVARASQHIEAEDTYLGLLLLLVASDLGESEARLYLNGMETAELVSDEDIALAHFQLALWYARGHEVAADEKRSRSHLKASLARGKLRLDRDLSKSIEQVREALDIPGAIDLARPFGPAMPNEPGHVAPQHFDPKTAPIAPLPKRVGHKPARKVPPAPTEDVYGVGLSPDGALMLSTGVGGELLLWDVASRKPIRAWKRLGMSTSLVAFHPLGRYILVGGEGRWLYTLDLDDDDVIPWKGQKSSTEGIAFHPDGSRAFSTDWDQLREWDTAKGKILRSFDIGGHAWSLALNHEGTVLAVGFIEKEREEGDAIALIDVCTGERIRKLGPHRHLIHGLDFSSDGTHLVSASRDHTVVVWDVARGARVHPLIGHGECVSSARFTPSGRVVSAGLDGLVLSWDLSTGVPTRLLQTKDIHSLAAHGSLLVAGGDTGVFWLTAE